MSPRTKIRTPNELAEITRALKDTGKTVTLCHGVFDLVHMGHVRHLEAARREGDILIVSVTADAYVNKGPGRPVFDEGLRAEMLSALEYVDFVVINYSATSEALIEIIRPSVYVKGSDYENSDDDITGKIDDERNAVELHGGRIVFTRDITFSSSALINRYLNVYDQPLQEYLDRMRDENALPELLDLFDQVKGFKVLMIGDAIIDEYQYVTAMGKAAKEDIIATRFRDSELFAGGVFAAANHVAAMCAEVEVITCLGSEDSREELIRASLKDNVKLTALHRDNFPTTRKRRFIEPAYLRKLFEVYFFDDSPLEAHLEDALIDLISEKAPNYDLVISTDFGHGLLSRRAIEAMRRYARFLAVNTQTNSANHGYNLITRYPSADYVCIDAPEARLAVGDRFSDLEEIVAQNLSRKIDAKRIVVTHGKLGCITFGPSKRTAWIPAFTDEVVDTVGAGDAFLAVTSPLAAAGASMKHIGFVGNAAGAMKVRIVGHRESVEKAALMKYITALLK